MAFLHRIVLKLMEECLHSGVIGLYENLYGDSSVDMLSTDETALRIHDCNLEEEGVGGYTILRMSSRRATLNLRINCLTVAVLMIC